MENIEIQGMSRGAFLVRGAIATGAAYGAASVTPWVTRALGQAEGGDVEILNFALTLEYRAFPFKWNTSGISLSSEYRSLAKDFGDNEQAHVDALAATIKKLGGKPVKSPTFAFGLDSQRDFEKLAITLEDTGVSAYNGAGPAIKNKDVLGAAGTIVQVEARHAAVIRLLNGELPADGGFDKALDKAQVDKAVMPLIA